MTTIKSGPTGQLQIANLLAIPKTARLTKREPWSSHPGAMSATAWALGKEFPRHLAMKCPCCEGWHRVTKPAFTGYDLARLPPCPAVFRVLSNKWVNIEAVGTAPDHVKRALADGNPLGDLAFAFELLRDDDRPTPINLSAAPEWFDPKIWVPDDGDLDLAISTLRVVGYRDEANAITKFMRPFRGLGMHGFSVDKRWRSRGPIAKKLILESLAMAWRAGGR